MDNKHPDWKFLIPLFLSIFLALAGYVHSFYTDQREARLARIDNQLRYLYGPLYTFSKATCRTYIDFTRTTSKQLLHSDSDSGEVALAKAAYREYMLFVIKPWQEHIENALLNYADLINGNQMPPVLMDLATNIADSKALYAAWSKNDYSKTFASISYPPELDIYAEENFMALKQKQGELLGLPVESASVDSRCHYGG